MKPLRILVVEDDRLMGMLLGELLESMGHQVCELAVTRAGAVAAAARHGPDFMIVDVGLGIESGIDAMDDILASGFVPHVFMSGNLAKVRQRRPNAQALQKPFSEAQLESALSLEYGGTA
jgi:two-component system, response regulator PdtaR